MLLHALHAERPFPQGSLLVQVKPLLAWRSQDSLLCLEGCLAGSYLADLLVSLQQLTSPEPPFDVLDHEMVMPVTIRPMIASTPSPMSGATIHFIVVTAASS